MNQTPTSPTSPASTFSPSSSSSSLSSYTNLIIVCGHATYLGDGTHTTEDQWLLSPFQRSNPSWRKRSEHETFLSHIHLAALTAQHDPRAMIIFSGGRTTPTTTNPTSRSEAEGYALILLHLARSNPLLFSREIQFALETHATDSYQNLLFSLLRFRQLTGAYPRDITVITHAFKQARFLDQHAPAIKWPAHRIRVQGLNPPFSAVELEEVLEGEKSRAYDLFAEDPYGVRGVLAEKRRVRNWEAGKANVFLGYGLGVEVAGLLEWNGGVSGWEKFPGRLPWMD
jgi:hypothetical protein